MSDAVHLVAVISPWEKISEVVKEKFRLESLSAEKKVMVWRDDLRSEEQLTAELKRIGVKVLEVREKKTVNWKEVD